MARSSVAPSADARPLAIRLRSARPRRAGGQRPRQGDIVLRARVIAKLLGMRLLTLDADIVIDSYSDSPSAPAMAAHATAPTLSEIPYRVRRVGDSAGGLGHAMALLEQSEALLASCERARPSG
jgi:hypothetical protein